MPINNCSYTFRELADAVLPEHMARMRSALGNPRPLSEFGVDGTGVATLLKQRKLSADFSGCYVLIDTCVPIYVGISRSVIARLRQHVYGKTHFDASLAYRIAFERHPDRAIQSLTRKQAMADSGFGTSFKEARAYLGTLDVSYIPISNALELYVFETYCAMELDTNQWNSFETH